MTVFETERLIVRLWSDDPADLGRIDDIYSRPEVIRWLGAAREVSDGAYPARAADCPA